jgi:hypothetical protein
MKSVMPTIKLPGRLMFALVPNSVDPERITFLMTF